MTGRGRARGRSRNQAAGDSVGVGVNEQRVADSQPPRPPQIHPAPQSVASSTVTSSAADGRAMPRGGGRQGVADLTSRMEGVSLGQRGRRRGDAAIDELIHLKKLTDLEGAARYGIDDNTRRVDLVANYIRMRLRPGMSIHQYHVDFSPDTISPRLRKALLFEKLGERIGPVRDFDGSQLFIPQKIDGANQNGRIEAETTTREGNLVRIILKHVCAVDINSPTALQFFNVVFNRVLEAVGYRLIGRNRFNPELGVRVNQHHMEVWPGFQTSILKYESGVMLQLDVSHKVLSTKTCLDVIHDQFQNRRGNILESIRRELVGQIVLTRYNNKTYRIDDIADKQKPTSTFETNQGQKTYIQYYKENYQINILEENQPLLVTREKRTRGPGGKPLAQQEIYLVPELCTLTGLSDNMRADYRVMADLAVHTRLAPSERYGRYMNFRKNMAEKPEAAEKLKAWGMDFHPDLVRISARQLPPESIFMKRNTGNNDQRQALNYRGDQADWSSSMRGMQMMKTENLEDWLVIFSQNDGTLADRLIEQLGSVCPQMGFRLNRPDRAPLTDDRMGSFVQAVKTARRRYQLVMFILPSNKKDRYDAIKKFCSIENDIISQVVLAKTLRKDKGLMSIATKIGIQMNCKLGGVPWSCQMPPAKGGIMVCGFDSYHDSSQRDQSYGAFVSSLTPEGTKWYSQAVVQEKKQELSDHLCSTIKLALKAWREENEGRLPGFIVVYRDGVGDGQLNTVSQYELPQLKRGILEFGEDVQIKLVFIVVKKRIQARFMLQGRTAYQNPNPGTIVDKDVTRKEWCDFFLVSQSVRQGTVTPTHYNVLLHGGLKVDLIQKYTYKMCHLYYNWAGTVRVPAPCQYAHKLAQMAGMNLKKVPNSRLGKRLWYL